MLSGVCQKPVAYAVYVYLIFFEDDAVNGLSQLTSMTKTYWVLRFYDWPQRLLGGCFSVCEEKNL